MKNLIYIMYTVLAAVLAVSCSKEEGLADQPETDSGFDLVFAAQGEDLTLSRTTLQGPEALQHVSTVYLYIFKGTGDEATCVAKEDVDWPYWENAQDGKPTLEHKYRVKYMGFSAGEQYTFVAMGLDNTRTAAGIEDNNSKYTYGLPESIGVGTTKLSDLQVAVQAKCNRMDIAKSEWFAGSLVLTGEQILTAKAETLNLYRRVAGVMGYFTDVPDGVTKLQICLYQRQNTKAWVLPQPEINGEFKDYVYSPGKNTNQAGQNGDTGESTDWQVLVELNAEDIEDMPGSGLGVVGSVIIGGSYVLPARASTGEETTLCLKLIGNNGNTTLTRKIYQQTAYAPVQASLSRGETDEGTGIIGGEDDSQGPDDEEYKYHYPIIANHFYSIGTKDNPVSLADNGEIFVIINAGWDDEHNIVIKPSGN